MAISMNGFNEKVLTFKGSNVTAGYPVMMASNNTVKNCTDGAIPVGIAVSARDENVGVLMSGYKEMTYSGTAPSLGFQTLAADATGAMKSATTGKTYLVLSVDTTNKKIGIIL